ncbi:sugar 3,4-ketoisomerase [Bdellovibrio sp. HCB209]|uniref:sugar 3,4-ketoisomerase n=1 Tax=Bdellovibrio sp. HCB209 TaxID=3394354 RepID=UPI0039B4C85A
MQPTIVDLVKRGDHRGSLIALESGLNVPFEIKRVYYIFGTSPDVRRGFHAHKNLKQIAVAVSGSCKMQLDDGSSKVVVDLSGPEKGLVIEGHIWREMFDFSPDCVLLVLADQLYDESDYIRNYEDFLKYIKTR